MTVYMNLENQVTSLDLSKHLKELGVKQESLFSYAEKWVHHYNYGIGVYFSTQMNDDEDNEMCSYEILYSAFTASEILEMLPWKIIHDKNEYGLWIPKIMNEYFLKYNTSMLDNDNLRDDEITEVYSKSLADACAKMLIHLIENKLIEV